MPHKLAGYSEATTAKSFGLAVCTLRSYVTAGLLHPVAIGDNLFYSEKDRLRLAVIEKALRLGFSLEEVGKLIASPLRQPSVVLQAPDRLETLLWRSRALVAQSRALLAQSLKIPFRAWDGSAVADAFSAQRRVPPR